ncbi:MULTISPECIES: CbiX/SirB N-terminal domain-containing protein [Caldimonas]|uniref:sirohydrochlorin chelatase n=1 Tax=Caldimonas TaxID=196013 RepID=UPI0007853A8B|nr:CbiX/SirB N-terminal domain-containing protein [Caldimonas taiwanensis]
MTRPGIVLLAHGARDPAWARPFEAVRARLAELQPQAAVALAYLEFMSPDLLQAGQALAAQGCTAVRVVPLFLGTGGHVRKDLPQLIEQLRQRHPDVRWVLAPAIGEHPAMVETMARVAAESSEP